MDNLPPGPCPNCGQAAKPLFNSYYCDCDKESAPKKCPHGKPQYEGALPTCEECRADMCQLMSSLKWPTGVDIFAQRSPIINGVQFTHWLECEACHNPAIYMDHDPSLRPGEQISSSNGYFQFNIKIVNGNPILCDSCNSPVYPSNFRPHYLHKY